MSAWENAVITTKGLLLQSKVAAGGAIQFTRVRTGTGKVDTSLLAKQTGVTGAKQEFSFASNPMKKEGGEIQLYAVINNSGLTTGYNCYQLGLYATDPDDGEILYAIMQSTSPLEVPSASAIADWSAEFIIALNFSNTENVTVVLDSAGYITKTMAEAQYMKLVSYSDKMWQFGMDDEGIYLTDGIG